MAEHAPSPEPRGFDDHRQTYEGFLRFSVAGTIHVLFTVISLVVFRFMDSPMNVVVGFAGILLGTITVIIGLATGGKWTVPVVALVLFGIYAAANVHLS